MKKLILVMILIAVSRIVCCATGHLRYVNVLSKTTDSIKLEILTDFGMGTVFHCPGVFYTKRNLNNDTIQLNVYYDVSGSWEATLCTAVDTTTENIIAGARAIQVVPYSVNDFHDTSLSAPPDTTIILSTVQVKTTPRNNYLANVYPNPVSDNLFFTIAAQPTRIFIKDVIGRNVLLPDVTGRVIDIRRLPRGIYYLYMQVQEAIIVTRFIKE
jgi:hypothetical protein